MCIFLVNDSVQEVNGEEKFGYTYFLELFFFIYSLTVKFEMLFDSLSRKKSNLKRKDGVKDGK